MNINDYKDGNGNVEVSENLVSDLIDAVNSTLTIYEHKNTALNEITSPVAGTFATVSGFNLTIPAGKYLVSFQTAVQASITTTNGIMLPSVRLYSSATSSGVGFEAVGGIVNSTTLSSWTSAYSSFVFETAVSTTLSMQIRMQAVGGTSTITGLYARTNFPGNSGFIRAIKIS